LFISAFLLVYFSSRHKLEAEINNLAIELAFSKGKKPALEIELIKAKKKKHILGNITG
jgi:hypothetical protein